MKEYNNYFKFKQNPFLKKFNIEPTCPHCFFVGNAKVSALISPALGHTVSKQLRFVVISNWNCVYFVGVIAFSHHDRVIRAVSTDSKFIF